MHRGARTIQWVTTERVSRRSIDALMSEGDLIKTRPYVLEQFGGADTPSSLVQTGSRGYRIVRST